MNLSNNVAGYNIVEVNASDDRSPDIFRTQLEAATQMRAVMGEERRPNCLVLDEIDGAPQVLRHNYNKCDFKSMRTAKLRLSIALFNCQFLFISKLLHLSEQKMSDLVRLG